MADYPGAIDYLVDESRVFIGQNDHKAIVLHGTGGNPDQTVEQLGDYFRTNTSMVSVHYGIGRDARIAQYVLEVDGAAGNCCLEAGHDPFWDQFGGDNLNKHTISIEHENDSTNSLPLTPAQQDASFQLVAWLCKKYGLGPNQIKSHASIAPINRAHCPGNYPWQELFTFLSSGSQTGEGDTIMLGLDDPVVRQYFTDGGNGMWKCKNGVILLGGNLTFYRSNGGPALLGLPLTNEIYLPAYPNTAIVPCERAIIIYDPDRKVDSPPIAGPCYLLHIDTGLGQSMLAKPFTDALQKQIADLRFQLANAQQPTLQAQIVALQNKLKQINLLSQA